jgi:hypothetical protein
MAQWNAMPRREPPPLRSVGRALPLPWLALALALALPAAARAAAGGGVPRLAYVDPGSGSFILQAVVATLAGAVVVANTYWRRIKRFLGLSSGDPSDDEDEAVAPRDDD